MRISSYANLFRVFCKRTNNFRQYLRFSAHNRYFVSSKYQLNCAAFFHNKKINSRTCLNFLFSAYYLQQCPRDEEYINECLRDSGNKLVHYLRQGVPELDIYDVSIGKLHPPKHCTYQERNVIMNS